MIQLFKKYLTAACMLLISGQSLAQDIVSSSEIQELITAYSEALFPNHNPFAHIYDLQTEEAKFQSLAVKEGVLTSLGRINEAIRDWEPEQEMNGGLVHAALQDFKFKIKNKAAFSQLDLQSNLIGLYYLDDYLRRYKAHDERESEKSEDTKEKDSENSAQDYTELPKDYEPQTGDLDQEKVAPEDMVVVAEVDTKSAYFAQRYFSEVVHSKWKDSFHEVDFPIAPKNPKRFKGGTPEATLTVHPLKKNRLSLFVPSGFVPYQPKDPNAKITQERSGSYTLTLNAPLEKVEIPITRSAGPMPALLLRHHKRSAGTSRDEWPVEIRQPLFEKFDPSEDFSKDPLALAQFLQNLIALNNLYSTSAQPERTAPEAAHAKKFQCDMAANIMVSILRDIYKVPSRIVAGFRGKALKGNKSKSFLVLPSGAHAWVEVYADDAWHTFDPTPVKKDKKDEEEDASDEEENPYSDIKTDDMPQPDDDESDEGKKQDGQKSEDEESKNGEKDEDSEASDADSDENTGKMPQTFTDEDLIELLEIGSLSLLEEVKQNPLKIAALQKLLEIVTNPFLDGNDAQTKLNEIKSRFRADSPPRTKMQFEKALLAHEHSHPDLLTWLNDIRANFSEKPLNETYFELYNMHRVVAAFAHTSEMEDALWRILSAIRNNLEAIQQHAHPNSDDILLVQAFTSKLPPLLRRFVGEKYNLKTVGPNPQTMQVARDLKSDELNDLKLIASLSSVSNFILDSVPRPEYRSVKTWTIDPKHPRGRDLVPLGRRFGEITRALNMRPGQPLERSLQQGQIYLPKKRQQILIPAGYGDDDFERISIVLFDTSGSMIGTPAYFQSALISSFVAQALGDVSKSGRNRHKVLLLPFDHNVHKEIKVTNTNEALELIANFKQKLSNTHGGTDIQKALMQAMALVADAEKRQGEPLASANIILMTDGQSHIDLEQLNQAREAIDRSTPLQAMFISIDSSNQLLIDFAQNSKSAGFNKGFYREFDNNEMKAFIAQAQNIPEVDPEQIFSEKTGSDLDRNFYSELGRAIDAAYELKGLVVERNQYVSALDMLRDFKANVIWQNVKKSDRPIEKWLKEIRAFFYHDFFLNKEILIHAVNKLFYEFKMITGLELSELNDTEQSHLEHLLRYAAGLEE